MKTFTYQITDPLGIHARPAGRLAKIAKAYESRITLGFQGKTTDVTRLMSVLGMDILCGATITITAEGADEADALQAVQSFLQENL